MSRPLPPRLGVRPWQALLGVLVGGLLAQVAGFMVLQAAVVALWTWPGAEPRELASVVLEVTQDIGLLAPVIIVTGATMALAAVLTAGLSRVPLRRALGLHGPLPPWPALLVAPLGALALGPTSDLLRRLAAASGIPSLGTLDSLDVLVLSGPLWLTLASMALVPGFSEELLFRGLLQRAFRRPLVAVALSTLLFSAYHADPHHVIAVLPVGLYLAYLGQRSGSLALPVVAHVTNTAAAVLAGRFAPAEAAPDTLGLGFAWVPGGLVVLVAVVLVLEVSLRRSARHRAALGSSAMAGDELHADRSARVVVHTAEMPWAESPSPTVLRKRLELSGPKEAGRVTSVVQYLPLSRFPRHPHPDGEEILVLEGTFSDDRGHHPAGTYLVNPEGFAHAPFSDAGCVLFVKLRQLPGRDRTPLRVAGDELPWAAHPDLPGVRRQRLYEHPAYPERVERWWLAPGAALPTRTHPAGFELFVLDGDARDGETALARGSWLRVPPGGATALASDGGCLLYVKAGHLP
ncbi:MAG: cupin domain-containing protein [Sandaracinaceae bacterium]